MASLSAISVVPLLLAVSISGCRGPRQWAEADAGQSVDTRSVMSPMASDGGNSMGRDTGGSVAGDGPAADVPALPPPDPTLRRLTVMVMGAGELTADGQPLACPGTCAIDRPPGTPVTLGAAPAKVADRPVSLFLGWSGTCTGKAGCVVTLDDNKTVTANFHRFVPWEEEIVASGGAPRLRLGPVGRDLYVSGEFSSTVSVGRRSFTSAGNSDGIVMSYADDGQPQWTKTVFTSGADYVGLVIPGMSAAELRVSAWVGLATGGSFGMQPVAGGALHLFLNRGGDLLRFVPTQAESPYSTVQGPFKTSPFHNRFAMIDVNGPNASSTLQLIDENGRVLWTKPDVTGGNWFDARVCDSAGSVVALHPLTAQVTIAGATLGPSSGDTVLVKVSLQGEYVWATAFTVDWAVTVPRPEVFCDQMGDVYVAASFNNELKVGDRSVRAPEGLTDAAVFKVRGATPQLQWLSTFGGRYEDAVGPWAVEAGGKLLIAPTFVGEVSIAGETLPQGQVLVRLDPATGAAIAAFPSHRAVTAMATHPSVGAYFLGNDRLGQVIPPP